ncbi:MAG: four helix bundle protein [Candidatus Peribacteraceae bacterium]
MDYKKLVFWQKSVKLAKAIYQFTKSFPDDEKFGLTSQMRRAAVSVPSNIAEGSQRTTEKEFLNFLLIAKGSLAELETQRILACELGYASKKDATLLGAQIDEIGRMLFSFYCKLKSED